MLGQTTVPQASSLTPPNNSPLTSTPTAPSFPLNFTAADLAQLRAHPQLQHLASLNALSSQFASGQTPLSLSTATTTSASTAASIPGSFPSPSSSSTGPTSPPSPFANFAHLAAAAHAQAQLSAAAAAHSASAAGSSPVLSAGNPFAGLPPHLPFAPHLNPPNPFEQQQSRIDKLDPMQNQLCRVCDEPAAGFHFGAFTCEGCKSFFGRTCNNQSVIQECKNGYRCIINKKNRTACKACRLKKCLMVGMSKAGSRYGRRSNWFKIHCLMQQASGAREPKSPRYSSGSSSIHSAPPRSVSPPPSLIPPHSPKSSPLWRPQESPLKIPELNNKPPSRHSPPPLTVPSSSLSSHHHQLPIKLNGLHERKLSVSPPPAVPSLPHSLTSSTPPSSGNLPSFFPPILPFLPPTFNMPGLANLPIHKQALLSPLLASSQIMAAAMAQQKESQEKSISQPPPPPQPPLIPQADLKSPSDDETQKKIQMEQLLSEHKALLDRFRSAMEASAALVAQQNQQKQNSDEDERLSVVSSNDSTGSQLIPRLSDTEDEIEAAGGADENKTNNEQQKEQTNNNNNNNVEMKEENDGDVKVAKTGTRPLDLSR